MVGDYLLSTSKSFEAQPGELHGPTRPDPARPVPAAHCVILESRVAGTPSGTRVRPKGAAAGPPI